MIVIPAVDIKKGRCVRLRQGKSHQVTVFSDDPRSVALHWAKLGAKLIHIVDLDGAFEGNPVNFELIRSICTSLDLPVQLGGGVRDIQSARAYFQAGVDRLIIGTMALENPQALEELCREFPGHIGVSLDAEEGRLKSKGWVQDTGMSASEVLPSLEGMGVAFVVYTDISRDGTRGGLNIQGVEKVLSQTRLPVIAAGGVSYLEDIQSLAPLQSKGLIGVITGRAIYDGSLDFEKARQWAESL